MGTLRKLPGVALALLACGFVHAADTARCELKVLAALDVELDIDGTVLLPVNINEHEAWMSLNMAQGLPLLYPEAGAMLGLKLAQMSKSDPDLSIGGQPIKQKATVEHLRLGRADFAGWRLFVVPRPARSELTLVRGKPLIGMLSSNFMEAVDVELDLGARKINLFSQSKCKTGVVYWGGEYTEVKLFKDATGLLIFPMELEGKLIETSFNTGSRYSRINSAVTERFYGFDEKSDGIEREQTGAGRELLSYRAMGLSAKGLSVSSAKIQLVKRAKACEAAKSIPRSTGSRLQASHAAGAIGYVDCVNSTPFSIGTDLLQRLRVYIATGEGMIYITRADAAATVPPH